MNKKNDKSKFPFSKNANDTQAVNKKKAADKADTDVKKDNGKKPTTKKKTGK